MPVLLKTLKKRLAADKSLSGKDADGDYRHDPPDVISRRVKDYPDLKVSKLTKTGAILARFITYKGLVSSETTGIRYLVRIQFHELDFRDVNSKLFKEAVLVKKRGIARKQLMFHKVPTAQKNPVRLSCSCLDFKHRFTNELATFDSLIGLPFKYTRKTDPFPIGRPFVNATDKIGYCKHVSSLLNHLNDKGLIKER